MRRFASKKKNGFTLIELMVVICIIVILLCISRIAFWSVWMKSKQTQTMSNMRAAADAMNTCLLDSGIVPLGPGSTLTLPGFEYPSAATPLDIEGFVVPRCAAIISAKDGWGNDLEYFWDPDFLTYSYSPTTVLAIRSLGSDGVEDLASYQRGKFPPTEYHHDLVLTDNIWYRAPR